MNSAAPHVRDWIDILQALLTPLIAAVAVGIAFAQWWTARNRFKLDLFDRRWAIYRGARDMLSIMFSTGEVSNQAVGKFFAETRGARWLLNEQIQDYIDKDIWAHAATLQAANFTLSSGSQASEAERQSAVDTRDEIVGWAGDQDQVIDALFDKFLTTEPSLLQWLLQRLGSVRRTE